MEQTKEKLPWWVTSRSFAGSLVVTIAWTVAFALRVVGLIVDDKVTGYDWFMVSITLFLVLAWTPTVIYQWRRKKQLKEAAVQE